MILEFLPQHSTWDEWNGQLVHYFGEQQFSVLPEELWREVAQSVVVNAVFDAYAPPAPSQFSNWQDWAIELTLAVNGA